VTPADLAAKRRRLEAVLDVARALVRTLEAELVDFEVAEPPDDTLLGLAELKDRYSIGRDALLAAHERREIEVIRGTRHRLLVRRSAVEGWLRSRSGTVKARARRPPVATIDEWEADATRELTRER
jgi:hypothetical protein